MAAFPTAATNERVSACAPSGGAAAMQDVIRQDKKKRIRVMMVKNIFCYSDFTIRTTTTPAEHPNVWCFTCCFFNCIFF